jgi:hypothetical protein
MQKTLSPQSKMRETFVRALGIEPKWIDVDVSVNEQADKELMAQ